MSNPTRKPETRCWSCVRSMPTPGVGCRWARYLKPVIGWVALETTYKGYYGKPDTNSFMVLQCPLYIKEPKPKMMIKYPVIYDL